MGFELTKLKYILAPTLGKGPSYQWLKRKVEK